MTGNPGGEVVKVRLASHVYTSRVMSHDDAVGVRDGLRRSLRDIGDAPDLITFTDRHGREVDIRAREVAVVELGVPGPDDGPARSRHRERAGSPPGPTTGPVDGVIQEGEVAVLPSAEGFLRAAMDRHPAGHAR